MVLLKKNPTYYYLNDSFPLFQEFKSIISKISGAPRMLKESLKNINGIEYAFIYGSFAKGEEKETSDIDLFIIGKVDEGKLIDEANKLEKKLQREISFTLHEKSDFEQKKKEGNPFILEVIKERKMFLIGDKSEL